MFESTIETLSSFSCGSKITLMPAASASAR